MISTSDDRITRTTITANDRGPHSIGFHVLDKNEFAVFVKDSAGAITTFTVDTHFSTASIPGASGTFTFLDSVTVPAGDLVVYGVEELTQLLTSPMSDAAHEANYDKIVKLIQQNAEEINRAWKLPRESTDTDVEVPEVAVADAGKFLGVSSAGALTLLSSITGVDLTMSTIGQNIATAADAAAVRVLLGLVLGTDIYSKSALDTLLAAKLALAGGTMTGDIAMGTNKITGLGDPSAAQDAATKNYVDGNAANIIDPLKTIHVYDDFVSASEVTNASGTSLASEMGWRVEASGTGADVYAQGDAPNDATHCGVIRMETGTTSSGQGAFQGENDSIFLAGGETRFDWVVKINTLAAASQDFEVYAGLFASASANVLNAPTEGVFFKYAGDSAANWKAITLADTTSTETDSGEAVSTDWVRLTAIVNAAGTSVAFYIDGSLVATHTTNINTDEGMLPCVGIVKTVGTTERVLYADLFRLRIDRTTEL